MSGQRSNGHTVLRLSAHLDWSVKYRYSILIDNTQIHFRTLLIQTHKAGDVLILKGVVSKNHANTHIKHLILT